MQAGLSHSFIKFSPPSALLSNGNCSLDMVPLIWFLWACCPSGKGDQSISKLKRQNIGKLTYSSYFLLNFIDFTLQNTVIPSTLASEKPAVLRATKSHNEEQAMNKNVLSKRFTQPSAPPAPKSTRFSQIYRRKNKHRLLSPECQDCWGRKKSFRSSTVVIFVVVVVPVLQH